MYIGVPTHAITIPAFCADERQAPDQRARDDEAFAGAQHAASEQEHRRRRGREVHERQRERVQHAGRNGEGESGDDGALRAGAVGLVAGREARDERGHELRARYEADHEHPHVEALMHVERQHRHCDSDD